MNGVQPPSRAILPAVEQRLEAARGALARLDCTGCGLVHERILRAPGGRNPLLNPAVDHGFLRGQYCDGKTRSRRLACAHTGARNELLAVLDSLPAGVAAADRIASWKREVVELDLAIIDVDGRKSDAELAHARQSALVCENGETPDGVETLKAIEDEIEALVREHRGCLERLRVIRDDALEAIRAACGPSARAGDRIAGTMM